MLPAGGPLSETFDLALLSDIGTNRSNNEDSCGHLVEGVDAVIFAVADGVGGYEGGEIASRMAIDITLETYRQSPREWGPSKRLHRAVQNANIEVYNRALTIPELRRMATTLTAVSIENGSMAAAHIGDCRLYLIRDGKVRQITKDHTMVGERVRMGLMSEARAKTHPERSALLRSLGHELIVSIDRIAIALRQHDALILCSDGLHNVIDEPDFIKMTCDRPAADACRNLIDQANARGTGDNLTVAVFRQLAETPELETPTGWRGLIKNLFSRNG